MKIRPMGAQFLHADERTNITTLIVAFHNSVKAHKNCAALRVLFHVFTTTTMEHSCFITVDRVSVLTVESFYRYYNKTRLIPVIKYIITDAFLNASFSPANYRGIFVRRYYIKRCSQTSNYIKYPTTSPFSNKELKKKKKKRTRKKKKIKWS
jgi:hypothetical protein